MSTITNGDSHQSIIPKWDGTDDSYDGYSLGLQLVLQDSNLRAKLGNDQSICTTIFTHLPKNASDRIAPWMKERMKNKAWSAEAMVTELDECFTDKDVKSRATRRLYAVRQGPAQPFAKYRHVVESHSSAAGDLGPTGAALISTMGRGLAQYPRLGVAMQPDLSLSNYSEYVKKVQNLATRLEALPEFQNSTGSKDEWYDSSAKADVPANRSTSPNNDRAPTTQTHLDRDGDVRMTGVNAIGSVPDLASLISAVVSALQPALDSGRHSAQHFNGRPADNRPRAPWATQQARDQRRAVGKCVRCAIAPSHPHRSCKYRDFGANPPAGVHGTYTEDVSKNE